MIQTHCVNCTTSVFLAYEIDGNLIMLDSRPNDDWRNAVVILSDAESGVPTVAWGVGPDGDEFWKVAKGATRYIRHECPKREA